MSDHASRIQHFKGDPYAIGLAQGRALAARLEQNISHYIECRKHAVDMEKLAHGALPWFCRLPRRFQDELEGMAEGANIPLQRLAEWAYIEECGTGGCSGAVALFEGRAWVARNNDLYVPDMWGYVTIREVQGRIPTINFGMEGDVFAPTGINKDKLWLHYNFLSVWDEPAAGRSCVPPYAFLTEALELCRNLEEVEAYLHENQRDGGMLLFAVDGKTDEFALFECLCSRHYRRDPSAEGWLAGTNHFSACADPTLSAADGRPMGTLARLRRMESLVANLRTSPSPGDLPADLIRILADDQIERRDQDVVTVYSNVACPSTGELWYTFGGYPAASAGDWQRLDWPWA